MQENMKNLQQQLSLHTAQLEAQKRETRAAMETLAEAEAEMETVHFEKKQLVSQWKSSLVAIQKRDEALAAMQVCGRWWPDRLSLAYRPRERDSKCVLTSVLPLLPLPLPPSPSPYLCYSLCVPEGGRSQTVMCSL